jgi:cytochrome P450
MTATRSIADLPGPRGLPILGVAHRLLPLSRAHIAFEEWDRRYGPIYRANIGPRLVIGISDAEAIKEILRDRPDGYRRWNDLGQVIREMSDVLGTGDDPPGVFAAEGEEWKRQRRLVITALNSNYLNRYFDVVRVSTERLRLRLLGQAGDSGSITIGDDLSAFTVDVIASLAFGYDLNTLERGDGQLERDIQRVFTMTGRRIAAPYPYWRRVKLPADRALDRSMEAIYKAVKGFIVAARERLAEHPERYEEPQNLLESMLAAQREDGTFTDNEIANNVVTLLFAGEDTTSNTLAWTAWLLASRPDVQERLAVEAVEAFGEEVVPTEYEMTGGLTYAEAVLRESIRLKSVAPALNIETNEDRTILGTRVPAGTRLLLLTRAADIGTGPGSEEFDPERWLGDGEPAAASKSVSFGAGPRFCPGRNLAFLEAKSAIAMLARNFEWDLDDSEGPVRESFDFAMTPRGLRVHLRERSAVPVPAGAVRA